VHAEFPPKTPRRIGTIRSFLFAGGLVALLAAAFLGNETSTAEEPRLVPAAQHDVTDAGGSQLAVLAGGCFWGVQGVFQHVEGVLDATSGYAGGNAETANYEMVETGTNGSGAE
jgi:peptide-methionine (S)-S-oxide reductase